MAAPTPVNGQPAARTGPRLDDRSAAIFALLTRLPGADVDRLASQLAIPAPDVTAALQQLQQLSLVAPEGSGFRAVNPEVAEAKALGSEQMDLAARRSALEHRRALIRSAGSAWAAGLVHSAPTGEIETVDDPDEVIGVLQHFASECRDELLSVQPGRAPAAVEPRLRPSQVAVPARARLVFQDVALRERASRAYLDDLADHGAQIRIAAAMPAPCLMIDRRVALLRIPAAHPGRRRLAIVRQPAVIDWLLTTFEQGWAEASPLAHIAGAPNADTEIDRIRGAILRLLADGEKDEAIARKLAISVRTTRRHIADYMAQVGASSRFQAGVIVSRTGQLHQ